MSTLVIRFSSLGDVVLCGAVTAQLAPVTMLTRRAWVEAASALRGVREVIAWEDVQSGQASLDRGWTRVVDLHASPRSRRVCAGLRAPVTRVRRYDLRRRLRVWLKVGAAPPRVVERYAQAAGVPAAPRPWIGTGASGDALALIPGAHHPTKRWPSARFAELAATWSGPVVVLGGPGDVRDVRDLVTQIGPRAEGIAERGFHSTLAALGRCRVAVGGDTGLLHLAAALGLPVVGLFGPTTSSDGFWDPATGTVLEADLPCRPCSLHGGPICPFGDHRCMVDLDVDGVAAAVSEQAPT